MLLCFKSNIYTYLSFRAQRGIYLFLVFFFIANFSFAQTDPFTHKVTLAAQKEPIESVLSTITKQTGIRFSYNSQIIDPKTKVSINAQNKTIKEVLTIILPPYVLYKKVGEHIIFFTEEQNSLSPYVQKIPLVVEEQISFVRNDEKKTSYNNGSLQDSCLNSVGLTNSDEMKPLFTELLIAAAMAVTPVLADDSLHVTTDTLLVTRYALQETENLITSVAKDSIADEISPTSLVIKPIQLTFIYPLGTGWVKSPCNNYHASLNILGGVTGRTMGIDLGGLFNINTSAAKGVQFAGLFNLTGSNCSEFQSKNAQFSGIFNYTKKGESAQFGGVFNMADNAWIQAGGIFNIAQKKSVAQFAGIFNMGCTAHSQVAGIANIACHTAFQAAGIVNISEKSACQIAGVVNVTKKGKFQMGVINVRDTADGVSLGLINIVKKGGILEAGIEAGEFVHSALTFRSGTQRLYSIISVGYNYTEKFWSAGAGLGTGIKLIGNLTLNLELCHAQLFSTQKMLWQPHRWNTFCQFKPMLNYRFAKHFKMYAGPSFNLLIQNSVSVIYADDLMYQKQIEVPYSLYNRNVNNADLDLWIGVVGGVKF